MERCRRGDAPRSETSAFLGSFTPRSGKEGDEDEEENHRDAYNYPDPVKGQPQRYLVEKFGGGLREEGSVSVPRLVVAVVCLALIPVGVSVSSILTLAVVALVLCGLAAFETATSHEFMRELRTR
jgi:hypothetical protein